MSDLVGNPKTGFLTTRLSYCIKKNIPFNQNIWEAQWPSGRASDSGARGRGFDPHSGHSVESLSKIHLPPKNTGNTQEAVAPSRQD